MVVNNGNPIALAVGANPILVEVTAQDGTTKITYTVTVTRAAGALSSDATLSNLTSSTGTLTPSFAPADDGLYPRGWSFRDNTDADADGK